MVSDRNEAITTAKELLSLITEYIEGKNERGIGTGGILSIIDHLKTLMESHGLTAQELGTSQKEIDSLHKKVHFTAAKLWLSCADARGHKTLGFVIVLMGHMIEADATPKDLGITDPKLIEKIEDYKKRLASTCATN